jgi:hypothetical protein
MSDIDRLASQLAEVASAVRGLSMTMFLALTAIAIAIFLRRP